MEQDPSREDALQAVADEPVSCATPAQVAELVAGASLVNPAVGGEFYASGSARGSNDVTPPSKRKRERDAAGDSSQGDNTPLDAGKSNKKPTGGRRTTVKQEGGNNQPAEKDEVEKALADLKPLKAKLSQVTSRCSDFLEAVSSSPKYSWANNEFQLKQLRNARSTLDHLKVGSPFWSDWVLDDDFLKRVTKIPQSRS